MKKTIKLNERELRTMIFESAKRVLKEANTTHIKRIDEMSVSSKGISFPIDVINRNGEKIHIEKKMCEGKWVYTLNANDGQFNYATLNFEDCLNFARLTIDELKRTSR